MLASPTIIRPDASEYSPAVSDYIRLVPEGDLLSILDTQLANYEQLIGPLSDEQSLLRHPRYTWSIKQVMGHLADCERVFGYRAMRLARNDATPLPGFDENAFVQFSDFDRCPIVELLAEFALARRSHLLMFEHLEADAWTRASVVNGHRMTVRAVACVMAGHAEHHLQILRKRLAG